MWAQVLLVAVGLELMAAPALFGYAGSAATNDRIVGPAVAAIAFLAVSRITRGLRWVNLLPGAWLLLAPWVLDYAGEATVNSLLAGALILGLAWVGRVDQSRYGGGWETLFDTARLPWRRREEQRAAGDRQGGP